MNDWKVSVACIKCGPLMLSVTGPRDSEAAMRRAEAMHDYSHTRSGKIRDYCCFSLDAAEDDENEP